jgi:hypothetical protein
LAAPALSDHAASALYTEQLKRMAERGKMKYKLQTKTQLKQRVPLAGMVMGHHMANFF